MTWAILGDGSRVLVHTELGSQESYEDWLEHFRGPVRRGLPTPLITVSTAGACAPRTPWSAASSRSGAARR